MACTARHQASGRLLAILGGGFIWGLNERPAISASNDLAVCSGPSLVIEGVLSSNWVDAVQDVRDRLRKNADLDRCAALRFEVVEDSLLIRVTTSNGRKAMRSVTSPQKLISTVEALTVLPPTLPPGPAAPDPRDVPDDLVDGPRTAQPSPTSTAHMEVGAGAAGRLAGAPLYGGGGLATFAQLALEHWLVGVSARWDAVDDTLGVPSPSGFNMQTFEVGIGLGRRTQLGNFNVDAVIGPEVVVESQEAEGIADGLGGTASDVRFDFLVRMSVPRAGHSRFYAGVDADVSPSRLRRTKQLDPGLPALPAWSSGLQIGFLWGTR